MLKLIFILFYNCKLKKKGKILKKIIRDTSDKLYQNKLIKSEILKVLLFKSIF